MQNVTAGKRFAYGVIDIAAFTALTLWLASFLGWAPRFDFMQAYTPDEQNQYWNMLGLAFAIVSVASVGSHALTGRSAGKWLLGARSVRLDGSRLGIAGAIRRFVAMVLLAALIFLPGPLIGFLLGPGTELFSALALIFGFVAVPMLALVGRAPDGLPVWQRLFGYRTIEDQPRSEPSHAS